MKVPRGLDLYKWWNRAACKGKSVDLLSRHDCYGCLVQSECLWVAILEDDRLGDHALFIRGGLPANRRDKIWYMYKKDPHDTYIACRVEAERMKVGKKRQRKDKTDT